MMLGKVGALIVSLIVLGLMGAALTTPMIVIEINEKSVLALFKAHVSMFHGMSDDDILRSLSQFGVQITSSIHSFSIVSGAKELWLKGDYIPSAAIIAFSIILPVLKTLYLLVRSVLRTEARSAVAVIALDKLQRFAMLDVFVTSILVFIASKGFGYEVSFGPGFYLFIAYYAAHVAATWLILPASDVTSSRMVRRGAEA